MKPLLVILCCMTFSLFALIEPAPDLKSIEERIGVIDENTLVAFDVDEVLIVPADTIGHPLAEEIRATVDEKFLNALTKEKRDYYHSTFLAQAKMRLVNEKFPALIRMLQEKKAKTIGLTMATSGSFGNIPRFEDHRKQELGQFGIDFSSSFPTHPFIAFNQFPIQEEYYGHPLFKHGILFTAGHNKGTILTTFLKEVNWTPKRVIFIDDKRYNLEHVEEALKTLGVNNYIGFEYSEAKSLPMALDPASVEKQVDHFLRTEKWVSDTSIQR